MVPNYCLTIFSGIFQCFNIWSRLQFSVNALREKIQGENVNIIGECSLGKSETDLKFESAKAILISTTKSKPKLIKKEISLYEAI